MTKKESECKECFYYKKYQDQFQKKRWGFIDIAIAGTLFFIILYIILMNFDNPNPIWSYQWKKDIELSMSSVTSIAAVYWALYAVKKYWKFANFEYLIESVFNEIDRFRKKFKKMGDLLELPGIQDMVSMFKPGKSEIKKDPTELLKKYEKKD